ncbi:molecular chaperone DnaJ [Sphingobium sp. EM0848]|uniref:molecular chaperone DnaJ n=1 Tax=Sphingobium sp. EM0848 TaxID=2743473 RepID=UPI00159C88B2|nr:molecular chaperone DnaJ [Sphingobium sp. EM0848]
MGLFALLLVGLAGWLIWTGRLQRMSGRDGMALGAALVGAVMAAKGKPLIGAPLLVGATLFFFAKSQPGRKKTRSGKPASQTISSQAIIDARKLLGVGPDSDARAIRAAHRRLIASVHPDKGGTEALAAQINAARDLLIGDLAQRN